MQSIQELIINLTLFISNVLLPFLFGLALLFFVWNTFKFFIAGAGDTTAKENAKNLALYGIGGFVLLVSIWGIVNMLVNGLGWGGTNEVVPDYIFDDPYSGDGYYYHESSDPYYEPFRGPR